MLTWEKWSNHQFYTDSFEEFLAQEKEFFHNFCLNEDYLNIIEGCCGDGSFLFPIAEQLKLNYLGIDKEPIAIRKLNTIIQNLEIDRNQKMKAICDDVHNLSAILNIESSYLVNSLIALPFNGFGILRNPKKLLEQIKKLNLDILIFTYPVSIPVNHARLEYYSKLGFSNLGQEPNTDGILFTSDDGFFSYAYHQTVVERWLNEFKFLDIKITRFSEIGIVYFASSQA